MLIAEMPQSFSILIQALVQQFLSNKEVKSRVLNFPAHRMLFSETPLPLGARFGCYNGKEKSRPWGLLTIKGTSVSYCHSNLHLHHHHKGHDNDHHCHHSININCHHHPHLCQLLRCFHHDYLHHHQQSQPPPLYSSPVIITAHCHHHNHVHKHHQIPYHCLQR